MFEYLIWMNENKPSWNIEFYKDGTVKYIYIYTLYCLNHILETCNKIENKKSDWLKNNIYII